MKKTMKDLIDFSVPGIDLLQGEMEGLAQHAKEVLEVDLISIENNPSIAPFLDSFLGSCLF
ncbi:hypothetical protein AMTRI_Chr03g142850 [Amborella trichopoda]